MDTHLLTVAPAVLLCNRLFGATGGHIRYVQVQIGLGRLMTEFRLDWRQWPAKNSDSPPEKISIDEALIFSK